MLSALNSRLKPTRHNLLPTVQGSTTLRDNIMATSLPSVTIPVNTWVNLYSETGISVGTQIIIQNTGSSEAILVESATEPTPAIGHNAIIPRAYLTNSSTAVGAWAFSETGTTLQVEEA